MAVPQAGLRRSLHVCWPCRIAREGRELGTQPQPGAPLLARPAVALGAAPHSCQRIALAAWPVWSRRQSRFSWLAAAAAACTRLFAAADTCAPACLQNPSLLHLLQQQANLTQQQQQRPPAVQQQRQQQAQARPQQAGGLGDAGMNLSLAALLAQQQVGAAAAGQQQLPTFGLPQQPAGYGMQPPPAFAGQMAGGAAPAFLPADLLQQQMAAGTLPGGAVRSGSGSLPPAILQHQQAALARQAAAGAVPPMPVVPPASVASNGFGPEGQQQPAWGTLPLPPFPLPMAGFGMEQQPASSAAAGAAAAAAPQPKRRGRQPRDPSTLTEKQLRAREAQKRFRDKQKRMMAETEAAVGQTVDELQRLRCAWCTVGRALLGVAGCLGELLSRAVCPVDGPGVSEP